MQHDPLQFLKENPVFWSKLGFCYDPPLPNAEGKPLTFVEDLSFHGKDHRSFAKAGVKIHTCILHSGWVGVDTYDYSLTDRVLEEIFKDNPDIYFIPRVKLNVPIDWCYENPEEVFVYPNGPTTAEGIRQLVGTLQQDYIGYEAPNGYYTANSTFVDPRPNVGGMIARQSFSSLKWLEDAKTALLRLMDRIDSSPYRDRILGYHIAYGASGECVLWGRASERYGDYGITNRRAFYRWGLQKYGTREALAEAWLQPDIAEDNVHLPSPEDRYGQTDRCEVFFRGTKEQQICTDFDEFISQINANAIEYFAKVIKQRDPKLLTGAFYGYFLHVDNASYTGHLAMEQLLNSPYVDFFAAPKSYYRCAPGEPGGVLSTTQSVNRKKLWVDELDNRTHLAKGVENGWGSENFSQTRAVLWREFAKNLSSDSGFWWMDLGGGWFDDPEIMGVVEKMVSANSQLRQTSYQSASDILVLVDENSINRMHISRDFRRGFLEDFLCETRMTGCLADVYRLQDLTWLDLSQYKLIVFAYTFCLTGQQRQQITAISQDTTLLFNYAPGIWDETGCSLANVETLTGLAVEHCGRAGQSFPQLRICPTPDTEILFTDSDGNVKTAAAYRANGGRNILNTQSYLSHVQLRKIADEAGCHGYVPAGSTLYGDARFLGVFSAGEVNCEICLRQSGSYRELISGQNYDNTTAIPLSLGEKSAAVFIKK